MMPDNIALFATIILVLPMFYFLLAAPAFLLVRLEIPAVAQLLRAMFSGYFQTLAIAGAIGTIAVAAEGRLVLAICIGLIAAFAASSRRWFLRQMDARLGDRDAGDADAVRRLRRLHWGGMLSNAVQLAAIVACIPYIAVAPT
jgi:mannose/fructose/N-acetylgalactosamine-specific phosphotransferase system component IIC